MCSSHFYFTICSIWNVWNIVNMCLEYCSYIFVQLFWARPGAWEVGSRGMVKNMSFIIVKSNLELFYLWILAFRTFEDYAQSASSRSKWAEDGQDYCSSFTHWMALLVEGSQGGLFSTLFLPPAQNTFVRYWDIYIYHWLMLCFKGTKYS